MDDRRLDVRVRVALVAQPEGGVPAPHERADFRAERGPQAQIDRGMGLAKAPQALRERRAGERADEGERHDAAARAAERADRVDAVAQRGQRRLGVRQERTARIREHDAAPDALEQRRAQGTF